MVLVLENVPAETAEGSRIPHSITPTLFHTRLFPSEPCVSCGSLDRVISSPNVQPQAAWHGSRGVAGVA